jgi:hypothetical protein
MPQYAIVSVCRLFLQLYTVKQQSQQSAVNKFGIRLSQKFFLRNLCKKLFVKSLQFGYAL